jgi:hypothetical protein
MPTVIRRYGSKSDALESVIRIHVLCCDSTLSTAWDAVVFSSMISRMTAKLYPISLLKFDRRAPASALIENSGDDF